LEVVLPLALAPPPPCCAAADAQQSVQFGHRLVLVVAFTTGSDREIIVAGSAVFASKTHVYEIN
jgi:hypothetical protein